MNKAPIFGNFIIQSATEQQIEILPAYYSVTNTEYPVHHLPAS